MEGRVGALLGDEVLVSGPGDLIFKPRNQWHTFWNAGEQPARVLEIISPAGFERFFEELVDLGDASQVDELLEEPLESRGGDDLENPRRLLARIPERVPLVARLEDQIAGTADQHLVSQERADAPLHPARRSARSP